VAQGWMSQEGQWKRIGSGDAKKIFNTGDTEEHRVEQQPYAYRSAGSAAPPKSTFHRMQFRFETEALSRVVPSSSRLGFKQAEQHFLDAAGAGGLGLLLDSGLQRCVADLDGHG
jgi:hypothetical protein